MEDGSELSRELESAMLTDFLHFGEESSKGREWATLQGTKRETFRGFPLVPSVCGDSKFPQGKQSTRCDWLWGRMASSAWP